MTDGEIEDKNIRQYMQAIATIAHATGFNGNMLKVIKFTMKGTKLIFASFDVLGRSYNLTYYEDKYILTAFTDRGCAEIIQQ